MKTLRDRFAVDVRALAALRISLAVILLLDLAVRATDFKALYGEGVLPLSLLQSIYPNLGPFSLHTWSASPYYEAFLFVLAAVFAVFLGLGKKTQWMAFFSWVLFHSILMRNPYMTTGGDNILQLFLLWLALIPATEEKKLFTAGTCALQLQIVIVYWSTSLMKARWPLWWSGEGLYNALSSDFWARPAAAKILTYPWLLIPLSYLVIAGETIGVLMVLLTKGRLRDFFVLSIVFMQFCFGVCMYLGAFPWIASAAMIPFLSSEFWNDVERKFKVRLR